jgi:hypothetical protein
MADGMVANKIGKPNAGTKPSVVTIPSSIGQWNAKLMDPISDSSTLSNMKGHNGGIGSPGRSSKRTAATAKQDSVEKAVELKARQNLESMNEKDIISQPPSFISCDDNFLFNSTKSLGVLLGENEVEVNKSIVCLKDIEKQRLLEFSKSAVITKDLMQDVSSVCSFDDGLHLENLNFICSEIAEGLGDVGCDPKCLPNPVSQSKISKKVSRPKNKKKNSKSKSR